jgi:hypothetical protein
MAATIFFGMGIECAMTGAMIAAGKDRPPWQGAALGFLLGLVGLLIVALLPRRTAI